MLDQLGRDRKINQVVRKDRDNKFTVVKKIQKRSVQTLSKKANIGDIRVNAENENEAENEKENEIELNTEDSAERNEERSEEKDGEKGGKGKEDKEGGGEKLSRKNAADRRRGGNIIRSINRSAAIVPHRQKTNALDRIAKSINIQLKRDH